MPCGDPVEELVDDGWVLVVCEDRVLVHLQDHQQVGLQFSAVLVYLDVHDSLQMQQRYEKKLNSRKHKSTVFFCRRFVTSSTGKKLRMGSIYGVKCLKNKMFLRQIPLWSPGTYYNLSLTLRDAEIIKGWWQSGQVSCYVAVWTWVTDGNLKEDETRLMPVKST
jgi:hypothetical protein